MKYVVALFVVVIVFSVGALQAQTTATTPAQQRKPVPVAASPATNPSSSDGSVIAPPTTGDFQDVWTHASETSAVIYWMTPVPAGSTVQYGLDDKYGMKSEEKGKNHVNDQPYYTHFHRLIGLQPDKTYHFRMIYTGPDGKEIVSKDGTFATKKSAAIRIPGDLKGTPYVLDKPGDYILTEDLKVGGTGIRITKKINLDLDGHTITYNEDSITPAKTGKFDEYLDSTCFGIEVTRTASGSKIFNGRVVQGKGNGPSQVHGLGFNPIAIRGAKDMEIAGVEATYQGDSMKGFMLRGGAAHVHNCVLEDKGNIVMNRHMIKMVLEAAGTDVHNNLIKRYRQAGVYGGNGGNIYRNEMYGAPAGNNHCGVMVYKGSDIQIRDNYVFSRTNDAPEINREEYKGEIAGGGIYTVSGCKNIKIYRNKIHLVAENMDQMSGVRVTWGGDNLEFFENDIFVTGGGTKIRGTWFLSEEKTQDIVFRNNTVKVIAMPGLKDAWAISAIGMRKDTDAPVILYKDNTIISNVCNIAFGESYGIGYNHKFINNLFVREGNDDRYRTINCGWGNDDYTTWGHVFIDSRFKDGAGYDKVTFGGTSPKNSFSVGWTVTIKTAPGAKVVVIDAAGKEAFSGVADAGGSIDAMLVQYLQNSAGKTDMSAYTVKVEKDGKKTEKKISADKKQQVDLPL